MRPAPARLTTLAALLGLAATAATAAAPTATAWGMRVGPLSRHTVSGRPTGVDVSVYQHPHGRQINWRVVARHHRFVFIEATGGAAGWRSPYYRGDAAGAHRAGLAVGAYSFADMRRPIMATARADAQHFANVVGWQKRAGTLPPVLDVELNDHHLSRPQIVGWVRTWALTVRARTGRTPIVYTYPYFWDRTVGGSGALSRSFSLWIAAFTLGYASGPMLPQGWDHWRFWQAAGGNGRAAGVPGACDLDVFNGSLRQLNHLALRYGAPAASRRHHPARRHRARRHHPARRHRARRHHRHGRHHRARLHHRRRHHALPRAAVVTAAATPVTTGTGQVPVTPPASGVTPAVATILGLASSTAPPPTGGLYDWLTRAVHAGPTAAQA